MCQLIKNHPLRFTISAIALISVIAIACFLYLYADTFPGGLSIDHSRWAQFGDIFGGLAGGVFAFFALIILLVTLDVQHTELKETRAVLNRQKFESTFFELLKTLNEKMDSISNRTSVAVQAGHESEKTGKTLMFILSEQIRNSLLRGNHTTLGQFAGYYEGAVIPKCSSITEFYSVFVFIANHISNQKFSDNDTKAYNDLLTCYISQDGLLLLINHSFSSLADKNIKQIVEQLNLVERISNQGVKKALKIISTS